MAVTLRQIEAFRAVMIAGSVVRAGDLLHVSQPAVSRLVSDLEREVGYPLFHRGRGRLMPTEEGRLLFTEVQRAFIGLGQIESAAAAIGAMQAGHLRIVGMPLLSGTFLPRVITEFFREHGQVTVALEVRARHLVLEWLSMQQYDLGFVTLPVEDAAIRVERLGAEDAVCVLPPGHRLARRAVVDVKDLDDENFIAFPPETLLRYRVDAVCESAGVRRRVRAEARTAEAVRNLVAGGAGVAVMSLFDFADSRDEALVVRPFRPALTVEMGALYPVHKPLSRAAHSFIQTARDVYARERARAKL